METTHVFVSKLRKMITHWALKLYTEVTLEKHT